MFTPVAGIDDAVLRAARDGIVCVDADGVVRELNPAAERMFGLPREDVVGEDAAARLVPPAQRTGFRAALRRLARGDDRDLEQRVELQVHSEDGSLLPVEVVATRMSGAGATAMYAGFLRDLTAQKLAERERREEIERHALTFELGRTALTGVAPPELAAQALSTLVDGLDLERGVALEIEDGGGLRREAAIGLGPLAGHGEPAGEAQGQLLHRTVEAGGSLLLVGNDIKGLADTGLLFVQGMRSVLSVTVRDGDAVTGLFAVASAAPDALRPEDAGFAMAVSEVVGTAVARWRADQEITRLGLNDPLTGLANRPLFENRLEQALERSRRGQGETGLLFVDLDGFAKINDAFGHRTGDELLVGVGARLRGVLPPEATAGRLAGDDFGVLMPDIGSDEELLELAARIGNALYEPMLAGGRELSTSASIGAVCTEDGIGSVTELLRTASAASARARERGGGRVDLATQGMRRRLVHAAEIEQGLRRALTDGELRLHYQPLIDLHSGEIAAVEAFVRWQHPDHGLLAPAQFLAAADATGLAVPLGAEVLSIACRELAGWQRALGDRPVPPVHVNISARHCAAPGLAATVSRALQRGGLSADKLVLEIAETMFTAEGHAATAQLADLHAVGVRLVLDRFGTGYSSLAAIRGLPFDALKVDSSFVAELGPGTRDARLVAAMVGMAHSLGLPMTAAKVETEDQLRLLRTLGIDRVQGELFAAPLSAEGALELVRSGRTWVQLLESTRPAPAAGKASPEPERAAPAVPPPAVGPLSLGQAAQVLGISTTTARRWADDGRLRSTRTAGGHRRFSTAEVRRLLAERGGGTLEPADPPRRALPALAELTERHGTQLAELGWRGLYGNVGGGFFIDREGTSAAERWLGALASATTTANYEMLHAATRALMRAAEQAGASLLERHLAIERFAEAAIRALSRRGCPHEEMREVRRLFVSLGQHQLADAG